MKKDGALLPGSVRGQAVQAFILCAAAFALFILPFANPPSRPVVSVSYVAGADNRLAALGLALLSLVTLAVAWRTGLWPSTANQESNSVHRRESGISRGLLWTGLTAAFLFPLVLGYLVQRSGIRFGESAYFIERIRDSVEYHLRIYRDLEFPYGPLLLLPASWLHRALEPLHVSVPAAYFLSLAAMNAAGMGMVAWVLNRLPLTRGWRTLLFGICLFVQLHPLAGANYSLFKFAAPPFLFLVAARRRGVLAGTSAFIAANLLILLISPELAVGTAAGTIVYGVLMLKRGRRSAAWLLFTPPAAVAIFILLFGRGFIDRLAHASSGALNQVPEPMPHLVILGIATAWLAPLLTGRTLRSQSPSAPQIAGLFALALGILPGALGRCDPLHVFFNGLTMLFLSAVAVQGARHRRLWAAALVLLALDVQAVNYRLYAVSLRTLLAPPSAAAAMIRIDDLRAATGGARVATPDLGTLPLPVELQLRSAGLYKPEYYPGLIEVWDEEGSRRKIATMHQSEWMLAPEAFNAAAEPLPNATVKRIFRFGYRYRQRKPPFTVGAQLNEDLRANWTPAGTFGNLILYHRKQHLQP